jgi:hypothetical protein
MEWNLHCFLFCLSAKTPCIIFTYFFMFVNYLPKSIIQFWLFCEWYSFSCHLWANSSSFLAFPSFMEHFGHPHGPWCLNIFYPLQTTQKLVFLTLWNWALLKSPSVVRPIDNFPAFYGTWRFNTKFTRAFHLFLSWARPIQITYMHPSSPAFMLHAPPISSSLTWLF